MIRYNWICDDYEKYVIFCARNHDNRTICAHHFDEKHKGKWTECKKCKDSFSPIDYAAYATDKHANFEILKKSSKGNRIIVTFVATLLGTLTNFHPCHLPMEL
ncbi:hypothetical protein DFA_01750 [Cavenderia fasciculata]|uniref:Uncharacterized protein n=1 Tax=Cavenderia fasciculata TaxID=261658 RepID=F4PUK0_CACFS|nr:uncharacterized protein DFA_01750 [Cavenderia fasciculata]EGG21864.1 hypothetical protein DFA_01750 [Cavenderia fasciculata]|eukprot:XP_004359715.1 hypothetical protein DFA_01750 [Cavenderia fasciculata]